MLHSAISPSVLYFCQGALEVPALLFMRITLARTRLWGITLTFSHALSKGTDEEITPHPTNLPPVPGYTILQPSAVHPLSTAPPPGSCLSPLNASFLPVAFCRQPPLWCSPANLPHLCFQATILTDVIVVHVITDITAHVNGLPVSVIFVSYFGRVQNTFQHLFECP